MKLYYYDNECLCVVCNYYDKENFKIKFYCGGSRSGRLYCLYPVTKGGSIIGDLTMDNVEALASGENPFCPNGCKLNGPGCLCDGWWPNEREAI